MKNIERIGDHAVTLAQDAIDIKPIKGKIMTSIEKMNNFALTAIDNTCLALFKNDYQEAENAIRDSNNIKKYEDGVLKALEQSKNSEEVLGLEELLKIYEELPNMHQILAKLF